MDHADTKVVKSAFRSIEVLELLAARRRPLSLKEIIEHLGYPQSSGTVLMKTLVNMGYVNYNRRDRRYFPTGKVKALGEWIEDYTFGDYNLLELMRDLSDRTGEAITVCIQNDINIQYIKLIRSTHPLRYHQPEHSMRLITQSIIGLALMSELGATTIDNLIRRARIAARDEDVKLDDARILEIIRLIRKHRFGYIEDFPVQDSAAMCVLLPIKILGQPAVLGMAGVRERMRSNFGHYKALMSELSDRLG